MTSALLASALAVSLGCRSGDGSGVSPATPNIVLVTIDTLRADHLGCYGYFRDTSPNIDRFASESVFFERAYCPMATTLPSHASIFTGLTPLEHGVLANQEHGGGVFESGPGSRSLAEMLKEDGYATGAFVSATPVKRSSGLGVGFDVFDEPAGAQRPAEATTEPAIRWIQDHASEAFFLWVHYYDPHWPRKSPAPYSERYRDEPALEAHLAERQVPDFVAEVPCKLATVTREAINAYDGAVRYVDHELGRLFDGLRDAGVWDRSVVVVTSDHGEGLNQHDWPAHGRNYEEQLQVPLMIRFPGPRAERPTRFQPVVSLVDVMPTVLAGIRSPVAARFLAQASGIDVLAAGFQERPVLSQRTARDCGDGAGPMFALTARQWKYFHEPQTGDRLHYRPEDPYELRDVLASEPTTGETLRRQVLATIEKEAARGTTLGVIRRASPRELDPDVVRELESLGYVGGGGNRPASPPPEKPTGAPARQTESD